MSWSHLSLVLPCLLSCLNRPVAAAEPMPAETVLDDRVGHTLAARNGRQWRLVTDQVMGGESDGRLTLDRVLGRDCLRLQGEVSTANNGGFLQMALELGDGDGFDASRHTGLQLTVSGNGQPYNLHLRTSGLWFPWQAYRATFNASREWRELRLPFSAFSAYRTTKGLDTSRLVRLGLLAIGRDFAADLCLAELRWYQDPGRPPE